MDGARELDLDKVFGEGVYNNCVDDPISSRSKDVNLLLDSVDSSSGGSLCLGVNTLISGDAAASILSAGFLDDLKFHIPSVGLGISKRLSSEYCFLFMNALMPVSLTIFS